MSEQRMQPWALERLAADENAERRRRRGRSSFVASPAVGVRLGLPFFTEYGPTYPETPGVVDERIEQEKLRTKAADVARLAGDFVPVEGATFGPSYYSRFVRGRLSLKEVDVPGLAIRKTPSGTVEVVVRYG